MSDITENMANYAASALKEHRWAATGVSDYPPRDPLVGQSTFFRQFKNFIKTVDHEEDHFAHVFAVEGEWGKGKSRLGHELVAQINDCSRGWFVRNARGDLESATLFDNEVKREEYLSLYIRYSQVASEYQNSDNWFAFGLYKALLPLATKSFDSSIQSEIARQSLRRLEPMGFDTSALAEKLEIDKSHSDETLYYDPSLVTSLVQAAYEYFAVFGIKYVLVILDELETVAEAATFGLERDEASQLDGQAIRLIGKSIKEEDPRRKLPWLRYVALCSPLLGQQLREIQSTARRFELVELEHNAFADVSDYVAQLHADSKLRFDYPEGLVEAAYAMSGANFGWFNVVMANVDSVLDDFKNAGKDVPVTGELFESVLAASGRVAKHVLDHNAIEGIQTTDASLRKLARSLLFGQLPISLAEADTRSLELQPLTNEYDEPIVSLYRLVNWAEVDCRQALSAAKFQRDKEQWFYPSVDQGLNLRALLQNLRTFAVAEAKRGDDGLLIPLAKSEFRQLVGLLYNHPAAEFAADALWTRFFENEQKLGDGEATHIGPSVAMLLRLDMRYRSQQHNSMIFRDPEFADQHEAAMQKAETSWGSDTQLRLQTRLTGLFRLLDKQWDYNEPPLPNKEEIAIQMAPRGSGRGQSGGLQFCDGLKLHPKGQAWFAWVNSTSELGELHKLVARFRADGEGRIPVMAFTGSVAVNDWYLQEDSIKDDILLYHLNTSEIDVLERIGLDRSLCTGFSLREEVFTTKFKARLNSIRDFAYSRIHEWRRSLTERGLVAWPLRPAGRISEDDRQLLFKTWKLLAIDEPKLGGLQGLMPEHGIDAEHASSLFSRLLVSGKVAAQGYGHNEHGQLFLDMNQPADAQANIPAFLCSMANPAKSRSWTLEKAKQDWYWGYLWSGASSGLSERIVFEDWMWWCRQLHLLKLEDDTAKTPRNISVPRAELENHLAEARNWLEGDSPEDYPAVVSQLTEVYGEDRITGMFARKGASPQGTQTTEALDALGKAATAFAALKVQEEGLGEALSDLVTAMPSILKQRSTVRTLVSEVRPEPLPQVSLSNKRNISLEDNSVSLYERVERARLFAEYVQQAAGNIRRAVESRLKEIEDNPDSKPPFPRRLFTLSLQTIANILKGALENQKGSETQIVEASGSSDTLHHYLRSLQLDKASERLERLGQEAGFDITTGAQKSVLDADGYILQTYRGFLQQYQQCTDTMADIDQRIRDGLDVLGTTIPADYPESNQHTELLKLQSQLGLVQDALSDMDGEIDGIRTQFSAQSYKGQFSAMRDVPDRLLRPITQQLGVLGGRLRSHENTLNRYIDDKVNHLNSELPQLIDPLLSSMGQPIVSRIDRAALKGLSLHDIDIELDVRETQWKKQANDALAGSGVDIERWKEIAKAMLSKQQPSLSPEEQTKLVGKGILKMSLTFGGET